MTKPKIHHYVPRFLLNEFVTVRRTRAGTGYSPAA
jgi:hypothetical protein